MLLFVESKNKLVQGVAEEADDYNEQQCEEDSSPVTDTQTSPVASQSAETQAFPNKPDFRPEESGKKQIVVEVEPEVAPPPRTAPAAVPTTLPTLPPAEDKSKQVYVQDNERGQPEPSASSKEPWEVKVDVPPPEPVVAKQIYDVVSLLKKGETLR